MMKKYIVLLLLCLGVSNASALTCVDLSANVSRYQENANVRSMQEFLYAKGYLKASPNGYFGVGTHAALKAYQKANGINQTGTAGPLTRTIIKNESCQNTSAGSNGTKAATLTPASTTATLPQTVITSLPKPAPSTVIALSSKNEQRWRDSESLLRGLYQYFTTSRGVWPVAISTSSPAAPIELCVAPRVTEMASTGEVAVVTTAASPCANYVDVSYLAPNVLNYVPRDPTIATSSVLTGYTIFRDDLNNISITPKVTDNGELIKVRCNFDGRCISITKVNQPEYGLPSIRTLSRTILLKDAYAKSGVIVTGKNFTASTTVLLQSKVTQRVYEVGPLNASLDGTTFEFSASAINSELSCGVGCKEKLPLGDYSFQVKTQGGLSNLAYLTFKGFTTSSISSRADTTVVASSSNVKLGTITVSASIPGVLRSLTLRSTSTSANLPGKITGFKLKDLTSNTTITANGLTFDLASTPLSDNASRFYDLYANVGDVLVNEAGYITYGGSFLMGDTLGGVDIELPVKEISFSVAP